MYIDGFSEFSVVIALTLLWERLAVHCLPVHQHSTCPILCQCSVWGLEERREGGRQRERGKERGREREEERDGERERERDGGGWYIKQFFLLCECVVLVVGLKDLSDVPPCPHHDLVHSTRMLGYKGTHIIYLEEEEERERERERERMKSWNVAEN